MPSNDLTLPRLAASLLPLALAATSAAQTTYLVGPNGMPDLSAALLVAVDGDRIGCGSAIEQFDHAATLTAVRRVA